MMTLSEMSLSYAESADVIRVRITQLRSLARKQEDREQARALEGRIAELAPLLREMRELAQLTGHYYDRSYHKHERYSL